MKLNPLQNDRAAGVLVALAAGDALGAGYEFGAPLPDGAEVTMKGGGPFGFAPVEWTDDTSMAIPIAQALLESASAAGSTSPTALTMVVRAWTSWAAEAKDVGAQTSTVIAAARRLATAAGRSKVHAADFSAAADFHVRTGRSAGNGSLMRTAPLALAYLDRKPAELMAAAGVMSALTHADPDAQEACGLWCVAIRNAVLTGLLDVRVGLPLLPADRAAVWLERIETAERSRPRDFPNNGWVVEAFQGAWSAIYYAGLSASGPAHLRAALEEAVRGGRDTDTVAAIAGGLLGAAYGYTAVPFEWRRRLHGWPGMHARDLMVLGMELGRGEGRRSASWPRADRHDYSMWSRTDVLVRHPHDGGVWLGGVSSLARVTELGIDAVVSLCRLGTLDVAGVAPEDHATFWVIDSAVDGDNAHAAFTLQEAAAAVERYRAEGKTVLLHCVRAESRTPTVAALYGASVAGISPVEALADLRRVLPGARPNELFMRVLRDADGAIERVPGGATPPVAM
ncbi:ADP-ribosylglycohydrolase family protein [Pseudarthrobacter sp. MDT3-26]|uniref:ADP-ribosylglycohydrolase family protein n=1 Tax=Pseudarthrobacter raffinosi TaxID=2953651 RepID=UPI00208E3926|nr:ADP-ribosylglycohydrolase family protein [Pseudarthrobacter sp. MDT3-26]MCO4261490.1 ADP-ribosylglycohydrolase family protein [Pseudarthrobacter sp. MDT3-26]